MSNRNKVEDEGEEEEEGGGGGGSTEGRWHGMKGKGKKRTGDPRGGPHTHTHRVNVTEAVQVHIVMRRYPSSPAALSYSQRQQRHDASAIMPPTTESSNI